MAVLDGDELCINTILSIPRFWEAPVEAYHGEG